MELVAQVVFLSAEATAPEFQPRYTGFLSFLCLDSWAGGGGPAALWSSAACLESVQRQCQMWSKGQTLLYPSLP